MRTLILVVFTCFVLSLAYLAYWWMQPARQVRLANRKQETAAALPLAKTDADRPFGPGKRVWVKKYDEDTAMLASRFRADDYTPRADGWVVCKQPRAQFFMKDGRAISIEGESGEVIMDDQRKGMKAFSGGREAPSRGRLNNVTIHLYHGVTNPEKQLDEEYLKTRKPGEAPTLGMTITLNNASFDNQTFKIYSEGYGKKGSHVPADEVPVTLRGEDYDFDGRGLVIRWNERDHRLQLLEIAHGERLVIKRPNAFMKKNQQQQQQDEGSVAEAMLEDMRAWGSEGMRHLLEAPLPVMLAARNRAAVGEAVQQGGTAPVAAAPTTRRSRAALPRPRITPNQDPPLYRANFHENVKIVQGEDLVVTANKMAVDFLLQDQGDESSSSTAASTTQPSYKKKKGAAATQQVAGAGAGARGSAGGATTQATNGGAVVSGGVAASGERNVAVAQAATQAVARHARRPGAATRPVATTRPENDEKPVVITWTGKLVVEPLSVGQENPIKNGEAVVRLDGAPVVATQQGSTIESGSLTYRTEDQTMLLTPVGPTQPVVLKDTKGSIVHTARMDFYQLKRQAILYGQSNASFPQEDASGKPGAPLVARWSKTCTLYFADGPGGGGGGGGLADGSGGMNIERAELDGDVFVDHPQLKLKSNELDLTFDNTKVAAATTQAAGAGVLASGSTSRPTSRPATRPAIRTDLRQLVATGAVHCDMTDASKKQQTIDCNRLTLQTAKTADGRIYPDTINADGAVRAVDPEQDLRAEHLAVTLRPSTRPSRTEEGDGAVAAGGAGTANAELQSMVAHQNVVVVSKDGTRTTADQLLVDSKDGHNNLKLLGEPYATIVDKTNTLQGPIIEIFPDAQQLQIVGPGRMKGVQQDKDAAAGTPAARPIDIAWQRGMNYDGKANVVDVTGQVVAVTIDAEGAKNTARGERVRMLLVDAQPTTRPSGAVTQPAVAVAAATSRPATQPAKLGNDAMANKTVRHITFDENATVSSESWGEDGTLLRRTHLEASTLRYDLLAKQMNVPVPGRMIVEDHRPATTQPGGGGGGGKGEARPASATSDGGTAGNRGKTAFQWTQSFTYDEAQHQAVMRGDDRNPVVVVHQDDSPKAQMFRLTGNVVTAELESVQVGGATTQATAAGAAATGPTTRPKEPQQRMQLRRVTADGRLLFTAPGAEIRSQHMEYDPTTHWLVARGGDRGMVDFAMANQGGGSRMAEEVQYNTADGELKSTRVMVRSGR